ncbi:MAG: DegT/DnrJ/EryC1/StrS family aminotransferase [Planctomycetes bacterium]|nr:DegT/DnrJ/EryC1/StrS family aminotransferase [Planctomycetota bacterium]
MSVLAKIPLVDLKTQYMQIRDEIHEALDRVMDSAAFIQGAAVRNFEEAFAAHHGTKHCVATSCGTSALHVALMALGVRPGDEVIVPVNTFIATAEAVSHSGAQPGFVDMFENDYCIDPAKIEQAITPRTKVIIPVHLYGQPAELDEIISIARKHGLAVLEDCAQAHDAEYKGRKVGTFGQAAAFSFYPAKNLGAYGEGGAILTNDDEIARVARMLRDHGSAARYHHDFVGYNYRMHGFQGAVLGVKLKYLTQWTEGRRRAAATYRQALRNLPVGLPSEKAHVRHVYHLFVVRVKDRAKVMNALLQKGVECGIHYPIPLHLSGAYAPLGYKKGDFPVAVAAAAEILSLPMYPELTDGIIEYVTEALRPAL